MLLDARRGQVFALCHHVTHDLFAVDLIRHADGCGIEDAGMLEQNLVDFLRRDVDAAADDHILGASGNADEAFGILDSQIAGLDAFAAYGID